MDKNTALLKLMFTLNKRINLYEKIQAFLEAKIDLVNTLSSIQKRYEKSKDFRAKILQAWIGELQKGKRFADAIAPWIPSSELMLIEAGERSGDLSAGIGEAIVLSTSSRKSKNAVLGGLALPAALFTMIIGLLIMVQVKILPVFTDLLPKEKWPNISYALDVISGFIYHNIVYIFIASVILGIVIGKTMGTWIKPPRHIFDRLPPWSIYKSYQASSFLIALSSLMKAGVPAYNALKAIDKNASPWVKVHLQKMMSLMNLGGGNMGRALNTGLLDKETAGDVEDYSRLGSFSEAIYLLGSRSLENSIKIIQARMAIVKNLMLVLVAIIIVAIYYSFFELNNLVASMQQGV